jgi:Ca2+-binding RTX toxin-like protein
MATVKGTAASEILTGSQFDDRIEGFGGDDTIRGLRGNDVLDGGTGDDLLIGRTGNDVYNVDSRSDRVVERFAEGDSDVVQSSVSYILARNIENLTLSDNRAVRGIGNDLDNLIRSFSGDNILDGRGGADRMSGGQGSDTYIVDDVGDTIIEEDGQDIDIVRSSVSFALGGDLDPRNFATAYLERLVLVGTGDVDGIGSERNDRIRGNSGDNILYGLAGEDHLSGGGGNDSLYSGPGHDFLTGGPGQDGFYFMDPFPHGQEWIVDFTPVSDTIYLDGTAFDVPEGPLPDSMFVLGSQPQDADDRIMYNPENGHIYYDPNGNGGGDFPTTIAVVTPGTDVTASDFFGI